MSPFVIPLLALLIPLVVAPTAIGCKLARSFREMEHAERMKALELGRTLPQDEPWWTPARICVAIGAGVPVSSMGLGVVGSLLLGHTEQTMAMSSSVAITGVICGTVLTAFHFKHRA